MVNRKQPPHSAASLGVSEEVVRGEDWLSRLPESPFEPPLGSWLPLPAGCSWAWALFPFACWESVLNLSTCQPFLFQCVIAIGWLLGYTF